MWQRHHRSGHSIVGKVHKDWGEQISYREKSSPELDWPAIRNRP